jgi:hypothetical protein
MATRMRCAAKLGNITFGGYLVGRGPTGGVAHGTANVLKKALAMVGSGAKIIDWYNFGPMNDGFAMSECNNPVSLLPPFRLRLTTNTALLPTAVGLHEKNHSMFHCASFILHAEFSHFHFFGSPTKYSTMCNHNTDRGLLRL